MSAKKYVALALAALILCACAPQSAPETTAPQTTAPQTTAPPTTAPQTTKPSEPYVSPLKPVEDLINKDLDPSEVRDRNALVYRGMVTLGEIEEIILDAIAMYREYWSDEEAYSMAQEVAVEFNTSMEEIYMLEVLYGPLHEDTNWRPLTDEEIAAIKAEQAAAEQAAAEQPIIPPGVGGLSPADQAAADEEELRQNNERNKAMGMDPQPETVTPEMDKADQSVGSLKDPGNNN